MRLLQLAVMSLILGLWGCGSRTMLDDYTSKGMKPPPGMVGMPPPGEVDGGVGDGGAPEPPDPHPPVTGDAPVYANGSDELYELSPDLSTIRDIIPLTGCGAEVLDIAMSPRGSMFAMTSDGFYQIQPTSGSCEWLHEDAHPNSLAFLPSDASGRELLVGYDGATYYGIDPMTGKSEVIGALDAGYFSSGDIAVMPSGRAYLTVQGNGCGDCLAEIDPATGGMIRLIGSLGQPDIYGLAVVGGALYGFSVTGDVMRIDPQTAATQMVPLDNWSPIVSFFGAASPPFIHK